MVYNPKDDLSRHIEQGVNKEKKDAGKRFYLNRRF